MQDETIKNYIYRVLDRMSESFIHEAKKNEESKLIMDEVNRMKTLRDKKQ